jgi:hypothetical protein
MSDLQFILGDSRPPSEEIAFKSIQFTLLIVRLITLIFFTVQTIRHIKINVESKGKIDKYILGTLLCLGLSFLGFFIYRGIEIGIDFAMSVSKGTPKEQEVLLWELKNENALFVVKTIFRHTAYCLQNMALIFNIFSFIREKKLFYVISLTTIIISAVLFLIQITKAMPDAYNYLLYPIQGWFI